MANRFTTTEKFLEVCFSVKLFVNIAFFHKVFVLVFMLNITLNDLSSNKDDIPRRIMWGTPMGAPSCDGGLPLITLDRAVLGL